MSKYKKNLQVFAFILLASALLLSVVIPSIASVKAQSQATVTVVTPVNGTTEPSGTNTYSGGTAVTLTATPTGSSNFQYWIITNSTETGGTPGFLDFDNPATLTVTGGVTYTVTAIFAQIQFVAPATEASAANNAIVVVLPSAGGTTSPVPGTYALANAASLQLTATPLSGWKFSNWIISGTATNLGHGGYPEDLTPTDNPYTVGHGYGYTFDYQAVFVPTSSNMTSPTSTPTATPASTVMGLSTDAWIIVALAVALVIIIIAFGVFAATRRSKK